MTSDVAVVQVPPGKSRARTFMLVAIGLVPVAVAAWILALKTVPGTGNDGLFMFAFCAFTCWIRS